jgi:hypothetical protein
VCANSLSSDPSERTGHDGLHGLEPRQAAPGDLALNLAPSHGIPTVTLQTSIGLKTDATQNRQIAVCKKVERRRPFDMSSAAHDHRRFPASHRHRNDQSLQDQRGGTGAAMLCGVYDIEQILSGLRGMRGRKFEFPRVEHIPGNGCPGYGGNRSHGGQVLRHQSRTASLRANVDETEGPDQDRREAQSRAQDLAAAFSVCAIKR